jgi:OOP family OmpA-OmpF porin
VMPALAAILAVGAFAAPAFASENDNNDPVPVMWGPPGTVWCNPVYSSDRIPARTAGGGYVVHRGSWICNPETQKVEEKKQPVAVVEQAVEHVVYFAHDSVRLSAEAKAMLKTAAEHYKKNKKGVLVIGHTDRSGTERYNEDLSLRRAMEVRAELVRQGVPYQAVALQWVGETQPAVATADGVREAKNRRAQIIVR